MIPKVEDVLERDFPEVHVTVKVQEAAFKQAKRYAGSMDIRLWTGRISSEEEFEERRRAARSKPLGLVGEDDMQETPTPDISLYQRAKNYLAYFFG